MDFKRQEVTPYIPYLLIFIASFFNALMDATENAPNFNESRLKNLPVRFWLKEQSWKYALKIFGYRVDAWHLSKSCMVICMVTAIVFHPYHPWWVIVGIGGLVWNIGFWLFYNKLFGVK